MAYAYKRWRGPGRRLLPLTTSELEWLESWMTVDVPQISTRDRNIFLCVKAGGTYGAVGKVFHLSKERVRQIADRIDAYLTKIQRRWLVLGYLGDKSGSACVFLQEPAQTSQ